MQTSPMKGFRRGALACLVLVAIAAGLVLAPAASRAQGSANDFELFQLRLADSLQTRHDRNPDDVVAEIAVAIIDDFPELFQVASEQAYRARSANPSIALDSEWTAPFVSEMIRALIGVHGPMVAQSPLAPLDALRRARQDYVEFLARQSAALCAREATGSMVTVSPRAFAEATQGGEDDVSRFTQLATGVTAGVARAILAAAEDGGEAPELDEADLDNLVLALVEEGFSDEEVANLLEGDLPEDMSDEERCDAGTRFIEALGLIPDEDRKDILAFYLQPR